MLVRTTSQPPCCLAVGSSIAGGPVSAVDMRRGGARPRGSVAYRVPFSWLYSRRFMQTCIRCRNHMAWHTDRTPETRCSCWCYATWPVFGTLCTRRRFGLRKDRMPQCRRASGTVHRQSRKNASLICSPDCLQWRCPNAHKGARVFSLLFSTSMQRKGRTCTKAAGFSRQSVAVHISRRPRHPVDAQAFHATKPHQVCLQIFLGHAPEGSRRKRPYATFAD